MNVLGKYKKRCTRCKEFFMMRKSTPSTREYCDDCRIMLGKNYVKPPSIAILRATKYQ